MFIRKTVLIYLRQKGHCWLTSGSAGGVGVQEDVLEGLQGTGEAKHRCVQQQTNCPVLGKARFSQARIHR